MTKPDDTKTTLSSEVGPLSERSVAIVARLGSAAYTSPTQRVSGGAVSEVPSPGMVLAGKYRVERVLGTGGMSVVAAAYHLQLCRRVAIKYLVQEALEYPEVVERFTREARAAARIRGEHVAHVIDVGVFDGGAPFIVLEYLEGTDLAEHLKRCGTLPIEDAVRYILEACEALAEAHTAKIVHRDLKPANLFLAKGPDHRKIIKILDFGVSKMMDEPMTDPSRMLGTVVYMSPEQLHASNRVDLKTDIWSLGVILYELLGGVPPFTGKTIITVAQAVIANSPKPLHELRSDVPPGLEDVIARCLRSDPAARYESVLELAVALAPFGDAGDRESIRTITGVLCGSIVPPANTLPTTWIGVAPEPPVTPRRALESEAPVITPIYGLHSDSLAPKSDGAGRWLSSRARWVVAAGAVAVAIVVGRVVISSGPESAAGSVAGRAPEEISVRVTTTAPHARVRIDEGPLLPLPLHASVPRDDRDHTVRVEAEGHLARTKTVRFTTSLIIAVALTPSATSDAAAEASKD